MARIVSVATAVPEYKVTQEEVRVYVKKLYGDIFPDIDQFLGIFDNTAIQERYFCKPKEWFLKNHSFAERNALYIEESCRLGEQAIRSCLKTADVNPEEIHSIFFVSTTGLATPSIDAHLINRLNMNAHIKRTPIWGLGCAGGVAGLSRVVEEARAFPKKYVLLLAVELCGLTFCKGDSSKSNFVATSLFADGAAAVLVAGDEILLPEERSFPRVTSTMSTLWPHSQDVMGWDVVDEGLKVVFSKEIPTIISKELRPALMYFLRENQMDLEQINHFILHPGGMKVIQAYQEALSLSSEEVKHTASVLRSYGNMSSPTVLFVLEKELQDAHQKGDVGLMFALGPGFSLEMLLLQW